MALCPKCTKQAPEGAAHCGYCGAPLREASAPEKKTLFGYAAMGPRAAPAGEAAIGPDAAAGPAGPAATGRPARSTAAEAMARTQLDSGTAAHAATTRPSSGGTPLPMTLMKQGLPAPASLRRSQPHEVQPRHPAGPAIPKTALAAAQPEPASDPQPAALPARSALIPPTAAGLPAASAPLLPATVAPSPAGPPVGREPSRPVLASETLAEDRAPAEPGRSAMRVLMATGGLLLLGLFLAPVGEGAHGLRFAWQALSGLEGLPLLERVYLAACGLLSLAAALLPIPFLARALAGALLGLGGLALVMASAGGDWRLVANISVCFLLPAGLLHRWRYRDSLLARLLVALCVAAVLVLLLVPGPAGVPLLQALEGLGEASAAGAVARLSPLLLLLLALLSLLAFLGSGSTGLVQVWAVCLLFYVPLQSSLVALLAPGQGLWPELTRIFANFALLVYLTLAAFGLSQIMAAASRLGSA